MKEPGIHAGYFWFAALLFLGVALGYLRGELWNKMGLVTPPLAYLYAALAVATSAMLFYLAVRASLERRRK